MTTTAFNEAQHPRARTGQFTDKLNDAPTGELAAARDLTSETPADIDTELAELYYARFRAQMDIDRYEAEIGRYRKYIARESRFPARVADYERTIEHYEKQIVESQAIIDSIVPQELPLEGEYRRRGRWSRAFLVSGGHLHSSMSCSTCNREGKRTRFAWMTDFSGATEEEIVEAAASRACTTCFPSAPVDVLSRPSTLLTPDERQQAEERVTREVERARKAREKEEKAIANPDGTPLRHGYSEARTLVTANRELVEALSVIIIDRTHPYGNPNFAANQQEWADKLVAAIAHKRGIRIEDVLAEAEPKAAKRAASTLRAWG
ncbi:hypothetical protein [Microbacterium hominis]|uniref:Uncharacterized protein n=1 Tax=Microbacterium hominis TaxID=162426 RepID=A0A2K9DJ23_9MICO|nr:hypothetical protein [Microbacterium hominis]AUG29487.1 hypothetical protein CXR34_08425 [Microbacterium hominis]